MRKKLNFTEIVIYHYLRNERLISLGYKFYFSMMFWKIPVRFVCSVSYELKPPGWRARNRLISYYNRKCHSFCIELLKQIDCILIMEHVILPCWSTRKESNFKLLPWVPHDNECCGKRLHELKQLPIVADTSSQVILMKAVSTLASIRRDYRTGS